MGWWLSGSGKDIIGDAPADRLSGFLRQAAEKTATSSERPTLEDVLSIVAAAIAHRPESLLSDPERVPKNPVAQAVMRDGKRILGELPPPLPDAVLSLWKTLEEVAADYLGSELQRRPALSELLTSLALVLRVEGTRYMQGAPGELDIERIELVGQDAT